MGLRPVGADRLTAALAFAQVGDEPRAEQQPDRQRGGARRPGAEADVADEVEDAGKAQLLGDQVEHGSPLTTRSTSFASPIELEALTSTASPGRIICISASVASATPSTRSSETLPTICSASGRMSSE